MVTIGDSFSGVSAGLKYILPKHWRTAHLQKAISLIPHVALIESENGFINLVALLCAITDVNICIKTCLEFDGISAYRNHLGEDLTHD